MFYFIYNIIIIGELEVAGFDRKYFLYFHNNIIMVIIKNNMINYYKINFVLFLNSYLYIYIYKKNSSKIDLEAIEDKMY